MRRSFPAQAPTAAGYVVAAPRRTDIMRSTLRSAFVRVDDGDPFADLLYALDRVEAAHCPT